MNDELQTIAPPTYTPPDFLVLAIERGIVDPEALGKLVALKEHIEHGKAVAAYNAAMAACQREMPVVVRDSRNDHTNSRYASLDVVASAMRPIYTKHGLSLCYTDGDAPNPSLVRIKLNVRHVDGHGEWFQLDMPVDGTGSKGGKSSMNEVQAHGSTRSYGRRYLALMAFNIVIADQDIDGNAHSPAISTEDASRIETLIEARQIDPEKFAEWLRRAFGVEKVGELREKDVPKVMVALAKKGGES